MAVAGETPRTVVPHAGPEPFVFVSYSHQDSAAVYAELERLDRAGCRLWFDRGIRPSSDWNEQLADSIARCAMFLVFFTPGAVASQHVLNEVHFALGRGRQILMVHLQPTELPPGLQLQLGRFQAILRYAMPEDRYLTALLDSLPPAVFAAPAPPAAADSGRPPIPATVSLPSFHYGSVVPPDFFIDREDALRDGARLVRDGHGFLLVGNRRDGKTSFCTKLIHEIMGVPGNDILAVYLNLQQCEKLTPESFLEHAILNMVGEMARQVFDCKYSLLLRPMPAEWNEPLRSDAEFADFVDLFARIRERTHARHGADPSPLLPGEFVQFAQDLLAVQRAKGWRRCAIFFDEANRLSHALSVELLESNEEALSAAGVASVYAASPEMEDSFSRLSDVFGHHLRLGPFASPNDLKSLLARYCASNGRPGQPPAEPAAVDRIWELSRGRPYLIQLLAGGSFQAARAAGATVVTADHVGLAYDNLKREKPHLVS
jgi:TIR domain